MRNKKAIAGILGIFIVVVLGLIINGVYDAWQAAPTKEYIKIGKRVIVLGDDGDSEAGTKRPGTGSDSQNGVKGAKRVPNAIDSASNPVPPSAGARTISLAYTCIGDSVLFDKVFPAFQRHWLEKAGEQVNFTAGFALPDFDAVATSVSGVPVQVLLMTSASNQLTRGYSETKWQLTANKGIVYYYPVVFLVRKGNPKQIKTYADLTTPGIKVIHVNPLKGTGSGFWQVYGIYGSALKESEVTLGNKDRKLALERLRQVEENAFYGVTVQSKATELFLSGVGDVIVLSEFGALKALKRDDSVELVIPPYTIISDMAVFKMDKNISKADQELVDAFIDFMFTEEAQEYIASFDFRPSDPGVLANHPEFKPIDNPYHIDYLGEPTKLKKDIILGKWLQINNTRENNIVDEIAPQP